MNRYKMISLKYILPTLLPSLLAFNLKPTKTITRYERISNPSFHIMRVSNADDEVAHSIAEICTQRRSLVKNSVLAPLATIGLCFNGPLNVYASEESNKATSTAEITSKIYIQLKGLPSDEENAIQEDIITIGLFGKDAPQPVSILEKLVTSAGYPAKCKPKEIRALQREQLEANKVYNACMETEDTKGVNYDLSTVWRIVKDERIDLGAVSGKFVAREYPTFNGTNSLSHDAEGVVSVRLGNDGGFGFTIYPGGGSNSDLDETNIVVGRVIDGMDVVKKLNELPVIQSSSIGYKALASGDPSKRSAPSRACRYGSSELYCNEFKPLKKVTIYRSGVV